MPKGSKLKELWADPIWREQRITELRESREWIDRRARGLATAAPRALAVRKRRASAKNHDLKRALEIADRDNALLLYEMKLIKAENVRLTREAQAAIDAKDDAYETFGLTEPSFAMRLMGLTGAQSRVLQVLRSRDVVSKDQIMFASHVDRPEDRLETSTKLADVHICHIRRKLARFSVNIETVWGMGWRLPRKAKERLEQVLTEVQAENA